MASVVIHTYADAIRHCERFVRNRGVTLGNGASDHGDLRAAISAAYFELPGRRAWNYFKRHGRILTSEPYSTGTIEYTHTGGTYERQLTLTDGTWPTWAVHGEVTISDVTYRVEDRKSGSVLTLDPAINPGEDIDAGTDYELVRAYYTLPNNFVAMGTPMLSAWGVLYPVAHDVWLANYSASHSVGTPSLYCVFGDPSLLGNLALYLYPAPVTSEQVDFTYQSRPRPLVQAGYSPDECKGTVSTTADSTAIAGQDTAFNESMVGSIIRFSRNAQHPPTALDGFNPRVDERTIISVPGATSLTVDNGLTQSLAKVQYSISDPLDLEPGLYTAFLRCCEKHLAILFDLKNTERIERAYEQAYILAAEQDARDISLRVAGEQFEYIPSTSMEA